MAHLIPKDALVAEIERIKHETNYEPFTDEVLGKRCVCGSLLSFLNTLEVKEVDLENAAITEWNDYIKKIDGEPDYAYMLIKRDDYIALAKHFFELGLKAQHDNWKVVGDTNLPQPDKNKIYCVLSKNKYLLARVREHPHDELLQWKCTEFPFHCYDMCEGDKYMQIV